MIILYAIVALLAATGLATLSSINDDITQLRKH